MGTHGNGASARRATPLLAAVAATLAGGPAFAQGPAADAAQAAGGSLGEVVVTARKREETLQTVPLSITALTDEVIERARIETIQDVAQFTPGLVYQNINGTLALPVIRGLAQANVSGDNNVGMFLNGIYLASNRSLDIGLVDLARVEVIKGPQSALYGQNSFSGAINYVTKGAPDAFESTVSASVGSDDYRELRASIGGPLGELFALRLGATWNEFAGTFDNRAGGSLQGYENKGVTAELEFSPVEAFTARLFGYWSDQQNDHPAQYLVPNNCGRSSALPTAVPTYYCGALPALESFDISREAAYGRRSENRIGSLDLEFRFGGDWSLKSITALVRSESDSFLDFDFTSGGVPFAVRNPATGATRTVLANTWLGQGLGEYDDRSQELRLEYATDRLQATLGGYYYDSERADGSLAAVDTRGLAAGEVFVSPLGFLFGTADPVNAPRLSGQSEDDVTTRAVFGQVGFALGESLRVTAEVRRSKDERAIFRIANFGAPVSVNARQSAEFTSTTPRVTLDWRLTPDVLLYGSFASGSRAGGFNARATIPSEAAYDEEENDTFEVGAKTTWADGRFVANLALYYVDWTNMQLPSRSTDPANIFSIIRNTGSAISSGGEIQLQFLPTENVQLGLAYSNTNPRFKAGANDLGLLSVCGVDRSVCANGTDVGGLQLGRTVKDQASGYVQFGAPFGDWRFYARADAAYVGKQPISAIGVQYLESYTVVNARVGLESERWELALWAKNLADEQYVTASSNQPRFHTGQFGVPEVTLGYGRIVGLTATARFGQ